MPCCKGVQVYFEHYSNIMFYQLVAFLFVYRGVVQPLMKCQRIFQCLSTIAIPELVQVADAILAPVRLGICRPAQPFSLLSSTLEATQASEDLFTVEPLPMRPSTPSVEEASTQERPSAHRARSQRHRRRQAVTIPRAQEPSAVAVEGPAVDGEEVEVMVLIMLCI